MKVTIVGIGGLGGALAEGLLAMPDTAEPVALTLCARRPETAARFADRSRVMGDPRAAVAGADVVVLAVKPRATAPLLAELASALAPEALVVSCAAGTTLASLASASPGAFALARAMPNIGAQARSSTTALCLGARCSAGRDLPRVQRIFAAVGEVRVVDDETWLHPITAIGASGPAFMLLAVEALVDAGVEAGLPRAEALAWARGALVAAAARLDPALEPQALRATVTSPAGTTAAGLARLEERAVRGAFLDAARAAAARSRELG
ncbi:MAG: pyrroline-5-carboxylate reductase [Deltaproteobacteria bacterium]|nr:pyrroline-5-carboxylate reductase [Deltaproteobacteria bacterium]